MFLLFLALPVNSNNLFVVRERKNRTERNLLLLPLFFFGNTLTTIFPSYILDHESWIRIWGYIKFLWVNINWFLKYTQINNSIPESLVYTSQFLKVVVPTYFLLSLQISPEKVGLRTKLYCLYDFQRQKWVI